MTLSRGRKNISLFSISKTAFKLARPCRDRSCGRRQSKIRHFNVSHFPPRQTCTVATPRDILVEPFPKRKEVRSCSSRWPGFFPIDKSQSQCCRNQNSDAMDEVAPVSTKKKWSCERLVFFCGRLTAMLHAAMDTLMFVFPRAVCYRPPPLMQLQ